MHELPMVRPCPPGGPRAHLNGHAVAAAPELQQQPLLLRAEVCDRGPEPLEQGPVAQRRQGRVDAHRVAPGGHLQAVGVAADEALAVGWAGAGRGGAGAGRGGAGRGGAGRGGAGRGGAACGVAWRGGAGLEWAWVASRTTARAAGAGAVARARLQS
jgi:hypothetical protein